MKNSTTSAHQTANMNAGQGRGRNNNGRGRGRGRGHGRNNSQGQDSGNSSNDDTPQNNSQQGCGYSNQQWQNLTAAQKRQIYCERERYATACTVAAILRASVSQGGIQDDVSAITTNLTIPTQQVQTTQGSSTLQNSGTTSLNNVSQTMSRRRIGAYNVISKRRSISQVLARLHSDVKQARPHWILVTLTHVVSMALPESLSTRDKSQRHQDSLIHLNPSKTFPLLMLL